MSGSQQSARETAAEWALFESRRAAVVEIAAQLAPAGIELLLIKGFWLASAISKAPLGRRMLDVDVVVVRGSFEAAVVRLTASGWMIECNNWSTKGLRNEETGIYIDLHRFALPLSFGKLNGPELFQRSLHMPDKLGPHLRVPDPYDGAVISIGNFVKDSVGVIGHGHLATDLELLAANAGLRPDKLSSRLSATALRRVGIAAFTALAARDARWEPWREAMRPSRFEQREGKLLVDVLLRHTPKHPDLALLLVRSLDDRPARAALGFLLMGGRLLRDLIRRVRGTDRYTAARNICCLRRPPAASRWSLLPLQPAPWASRRS
jgi:hypothetical protein